MTRPLHHPLPLTSTLNCREWGRRRRRSWGEHPHWTDWGDCRLALAANFSRCWHARLSDGPFRSQDVIARTDSAVGLPTSCLRVWRCDIGTWTVGRGGFKKRRGTERSGAKSQQQHRGWPHHHRWRKSENYYNKGN